MYGKLQHFEAVQGADYFYYKKTHVSHVDTYITNGYHYNLDGWEIIYYTLNTNIVL